MNQTQSNTGKSISEKHGFIQPDLDQRQQLENFALELKERCIQQVQLAMDKYHHFSMDKEEIKTIVRNVIENRVELPKWSNDLEQGLL